MSPADVMDLVWPSAEFLPGYVEALERGWSPDNVRGEQATREEIDEIRRDPAQFVALQTDREARGRPIPLPDGSRVAFIADRREVKVLDLETQEVATLFGPEDYNTSYGDGDLWFSWSPTSQDLLVQWRQVPFSPLFKAGIVPADGSGPIQPITSAITDVTMGLWSRDATQIIGLTSMFSLRTIDQGAVLRDFYRVFLSDGARGDFIDAYEGITPTPGTAQAEGYDADEDVPA